MVSFKTTLIIFRGVNLQPCRRFLAHLQLSHSVHSLHDLHGLRHLRHVASSVLMKFQLATDRAWIGSNYLKGQRTVFCFMSCDYGNYRNDTTDK